MTRSTITNQFLSDFLERAANERRERYAHSLIDTWPKVTSISDMVFLGAYSWTIPQQKKRLLYEPSVVGIGHGPQTPTEIARDYLDWKYPKKLRATKPQIDEITRHRAFPCYAHPIQLDNAAYIDLKSAYWSILQVVGWDVDYFPGRFMGVSSDVNDFPLPRHKGARSSLVTAGLSSNIRIWTGSGLKWKTPASNHINYGLWALVQDVLHGVAFDMLRAGAVYVHTDGYLIPTDKVFLALEVAKSWGLPVSVKQTGLTEVRGVGVYQVGSKKTARFHEASPHAFERIEPVCIDWLRDNFRFWAEYKRG